MRRTGSLLVALSVIGLATAHDALAVARVSIFGTSVTEGNSGTVSAKFKVVLRSRLSRHASVRVGYRTVNGTARAPSDYESKHGNVTFRGTHTSATITVKVKGDTTVEGDEYFFVRLSIPGRSRRAPPYEAKGVIKNDDQPALSAPDVSVAEGGHDQVGHAVFTLTLSQPSPKDVGFDYRTENWTAVAGTSGTTDYEPTEGHSFFSPGQTTKTVSVPIRGDAAYEPNEVFHLLLSSRDANVTTPSVNGAILNDDPKPASCTEDQFAPNGDADHAAQLGRDPSTVVSASLCPGTQDWYKFDYSSGCPAEWATSLPRHPGVLDALNVAVGSYPPPVVPAAQVWIRGYDPQSGTYGPLVNLGAQSAFDSSLGEWNYLGNPFPVGTADPVCEWYVSVGPPAGGGWDYYDLHIKTEIR